MRRFMPYAVVGAMIASAIWSAAGANSEGVESLDPRLAGYPELTIRLTDERIEAPAAVPAGRTLLIEENAEEEPGHAFVLKIPDDVSEAAIADVLAGSSVAEETPEWFWRAEFLGNGDRAVLGRPAVALVDLEPGRYIAGDPFRPTHEFARFEVTATDDLTGAAVPDPTADVEAELFEMGFTLPDDVASGSQIWEVTNTGAMLHEIAVFPVPDSATPEQITAAVTAELEVEFGGDAAQARATIDALGPDWEGWSTDLTAGVGVLSPQRTSWTQIDLTPGMYGAVCFIPEPNSMTPHLMLGMTEVFRVAGDDV